MYLICSLVICHIMHIDPVCNDSDIRLVGTDSPTQGRLEVCLFGVWGSVCDDQWTDRNSEVVCRQLGYESSSKHCNIINRIANFNLMTCCIVDMVGVYTHVHRCKKLGWS